MDGVLKQNLDRQNQRPGAMPGRGGHSDFDALSAGDLLALFLM
jgi:hypothetical protein